MQTKYVYTVESWIYDDQWDEKVHMYTLDKQKAIDYLEEMMDTPYESGVIPRDVHDLKEHGEDSSTSRHYSRNGFCGYSSNFYVFRNELD